MNRLTASRVANPLILMAMGVSGLMTNCDSCASTKVESVSSQEPADGLTIDVPGCTNTNTQYFRTTGSLRSPDACEGIISGKELVLSYNQIGLCPLGTSIPQSQSFQMYWSICNTASVRNDAAHGATQQSYHVRILQRRDDGTEVELSKQIAFTTPVLDPCACKTEIVVFNSATDPDQNKKLPPGTYAFFLSSPYERGTMIGTTVSP